jgi:UDP-3-O-[3-hydroxymyristoyl] glucosamine N-acyltransferase
MKLSEAATIAPLSVHRDGAFESLGTLTHSGPRLLVFVEAETFLDQLGYNRSVACVITRPELVDAIPSSYAVAASSAPREAFYGLHCSLAATDFYWKDFITEIAPSASVDPHARIAPRNVRINDGAIIEAGAIVLERSLVGTDTVLRAGAVIGSQGFEFKRIGNRILSVAHAGGVLLGDRVEIQSNSVVDRSIFGGFTELGDDTKLDNLVHVGHNVRIGKRCFLAASAMIAGSTVIEHDVWIGPRASISNELTIGAGAQVSIGSVVTRNVRAGQRVSGNFAISHERFLDFLKSIR